jgi:hypothetical protein
LEEEGGAVWEMGKRMMKVKRSWKWKKKEKDENGYPD